MKVNEVIRECEDPDLAKEYQADVAYVEGKTGINVGKAEVKSHSVMGDAAGTCHIPTRDINFRADNFAANNARGFKQRRYTTGSFRHVARHEAEHATGNRLEGTTGTRHFQGTQRQSRSRLSQKSPRRPNHG